MSKLFSIEGNHDLPCSSSRSIEFIRSRFSLSLELARDQSPLIETIRFSVYETTTSKKKVRKLNLECATRNCYSAIEEYRLINVASLFDDRCAYPLDSIIWHIASLGSS